MTYQEILEAIILHRNNPVRVNKPSGTVIGSDVPRKVEEIEWALQALTEKLRDDEAIIDIAKAMQK